MRPRWIFVILAIGVTLFIILYETQICEAPQTRTPDDDLKVSNDNMASMELSKSMDLEASSVEPKNLPTVIPLATPSVGALPLTESNLIAKAFAQANSDGRIPVGIVPSVEYKDGMTVITWKVPPSPDSNVPRRPSAGYYARIVIDPKSGNIIKSLIGG